MKKLAILPLLALLAQNVAAQCAPVADITDDFESYTAGLGQPLPTCWTPSATPAGSIIGVRNTAGQAHSGTKYISVYTMNSSNSVVYIISPELSTLAGTHYADFFVKSSTADASIEVGTLSSTTDLSSFEVIGSSRALDTVYTQIVTDSVIAPSGHVHFAIKLTAPSMHSLIMIDDFNWAALNPTPISIREEEANFAFTAYPNPSNGDVTIQLPTTEAEAVVSVRDVVGRLVSSQVMQNTDRQTLQIEGAAGLYFLEVHSNTGKTGVVKVVKQ